MLGHDWQPLQPIDVTRDGQTISVRFHVPVPPLAWDEAFGAPHQFVHAAWKNGRGFEVEDGHGEVTITDVAIDGDTIRIGIDRLPDTTGAPLVVRYAMTQDATQLAGGLVSGRFGQLHDSDPLVGVDAGRDRLQRHQRFDDGHAGDGGRVHAADRARHGRRRRRGAGLAANTAVVGSNAEQRDRCRSRGRARPGPRACAFDRTSGTTRSRSS